MSNQSYSNYDYSDSFERFNTFQEATERAQDLRKQAMGEVLLAFANPLLMKGVESSISSVLARKAAALKQAAQEAGEEAQEGVTEAAGEVAGEAAATGEAAGAAAAA